MNHLIDLPTPASLPQPLPWRSEIWYRMQHLFWLKLIGTSAATWLFFTGYFYLLRHPAFPVTTMPLTALDRWMPFQPEMLFAYLSLWLYVGVAPGFQRSLRDLMVYGAWVGSLCVTGLVIFYLWPTQVPPFALDVSGYPGFAMLQGVDAAGNACPSMHVAVAVFTGIRLEAIFRRVGAPAWPRVLNLLWAAAIVWSTLAVKQHVALDAAAGVLLGSAFALASIIASTPKHSQD